LALPETNEPNDLRSVYTSNLAALFDQLKISLVVSTYQAGKAILVRNDDGKLNTHFRTFTKPMGIAANPSRLTIGGSNTVWEYHNVAAVAQKLEPPGKYDACYIPRRIHVTGDIDIHELAWDGNNELWVVNTRFCCLCTLDPNHSFYPRWRPRFVSAYAPEDRCHLNGLAMVDGRPKYVTALGETDTAGGWRANKVRGGILMDVETNSVLLRGLSMPHSPRWYREKLWVLESGEGSLALVDLDDRTWKTIAQLPGFTRGIDFLGSLAFIGLSQVRESAVFSGIPLVERLGERTCGVWVVHIESGETIGFLRFEKGVQEIFAVQVLRGIRFPELLEWSDERMAHSYVLPDEALAEVVLPTPEQAAQTATHHFQMANRLYEEGKLEEAVAAYRRCLELEPSYPNGRFNLAVALGDAERYSEAAVYMEGVIRDDPDRAEAYNSLGYLASRRGEPDKAISYWRRAIQLRPDYAQAHFSLGLTLLQIGDYESGFSECEWRWRTGHLTPLRFAQPRWDGRPISGRTLLVIFEQGISDAVQLARFLPLAAERCGKLILSCPPDLMPLFSAVSGIAQLCEPRQIRDIQFDYYLPLLSLPYVFGTKLDTIPANVPYLDAARLCGNRDSFAPLASPSPKIGIYWRNGNPPRNHQGSCGLSDWVPILRTGGIIFYSLQREQDNLDLERLPADIQVRKPDPAPADVRDLARIIEQLDLVVSVDASVIHLAGAMGKPVWSLLAFTPDWRWMLTGESTPWYPTMRLFRQLQPGDWTGVMAQLAQSLKRMEWQIQGSRS
jgi:uncharacterized protein (TIGR03032 family)